MQKIYIIYDVKSESYTAPTINPARGQAIRSFSDAINNPGSVIHDHPEDFTLFEIGTYDHNTGEIILHKSKEACANGVDLVIAPEIPQIHAA